MRHLVENMNEVAESVASDLCPTFFSQEERDRIVYLVKRKLYMALDALVPETTEQIRLIVNSKCSLSSHLQDLNTKYIGSELAKIVIPPPNTIDTTV